MLDVLALVSFALALYGAAYIAAGVIGIDSFRLMSIERGQIHEAFARIGVAFLAMWIVTGGDVPNAEQWVFFLAVGVAFAAFFFVPRLIETTAKARKSG